MWCFSPLCRLKPFVIRKKQLDLGIKHSTSTLVETLKNNFLLNFISNLLLFGIVSFLAEKNEEWRFRLAFGVCSNQTLVKIYNSQLCPINLLFLLGDNLEKVWSLKFLLCYHDDRKTFHTPLPLTWSFFNQVVIAPWYARRLASGVVPGSNPVRERITNSE